MIIHGDLLDVLPTLEANSLDACVTDPPYELAFMGKKWDATGIAFNPETWRQVLRVLKPGGYLVACGGTRTAHRMVTAIEDAGFETRDSLAWIYGSGFPKSLNLGDGRGTALKPAHEPIALAWKPFKGTITANLERWGVGALNIDGCRLACIGESLDGGRISSTSEGWDRPWKADEDARQRAMIRGAEAVARAESLGRWPANVLLDEDAAAALDEMTGELTSGANPTRRGSDKFRDVYSDFAGQEECDAARGADSGGASRFYYVAKPSREERDYGCEGLPRTSAAEITGRKPGSAGLQNPRAGVRAGSQHRDVNERSARNTHPTVKPVELMRWLVKLVTPPGGKVLDPFLGSGTTGMACRYEHRDFVGVEKAAEYVAIAERRIAAVAPLFAEGVA